ncbi:PepSY-like domain-containing protein [Nibrella viscosa]
MKKLVMMALVAATGFGLYGCNQNQQVDATNAVVEASSARLAASLTNGGGRVKLTKVEVSAISADVLAYIAANYAGAEIKHAGKDADGNLVVMIALANTPKAILFDSNNAFKQEMTFECKGPGGPRGDMTKIDVATLPSAVTTYTNSNYAGAEIKGAAKDKDGNIVVMLVQDNTPKALLFDANGNFKQVMEMKGGPKGPGGNGKRGDWAEVAVADLPQATTSYISTTYANAKIKRAAKSKTNGKFTVLIQTSDNQHVALLFAADGTFEKALTKK